MALVQQGINLKEIMTEIAAEAGKIKRKTSTLIDYYIYPDSTPSAISAYDPRLSILEARTKALNKISFPHLKQLLDHAEATGASYVNDIIDQLLNAVHGLDEVFKEHYDHTLAERKPYFAIYKLLEWRERTLKDFIRDDMMDGAPLRPEAVRPADPLYFCRGAIMILNMRDQGRVRPVRDKDLSDANAGVVRRFGGGYLWWECPACKFRARFHVVNSNNLSIHTVEEVREHPGLAIEYRSAFLAKSHLFTPANSADERLRRRSSFGFGGGSASVADTPKYGCVFCFAEGKKLDADKATAFETSRELADHLVRKHKSTLPPSLLLQKFNVAVKGKCAEGARRWDVNFR